MSETRTFVGNVDEASVLREYAQFESSSQQKAFEALGAAFRSTVDPQIIRLKKYSIEKINN